VHPAVDQALELAAVRAHERALGLDVVPRVAMRRPVADSFG
jgi:hypothetical protein